MSSASSQSMAAAAATTIALSDALAAKALSKLATEAAGPETVVERLMMKVLMSMMMV